MRKTILIGGIILENAKLMRPLFYCNMFNADGKRMRAVFEREVSNGTDAYRLWHGSGIPDRDYLRGSG